MVSEAKAPDLSPEVDKARFSRSKMQESHCKSAAHVATQRTTTEILVYYSHFSGLRDGATTICDKGQSEFIRNGCRARSSHRMTAGSDANMHIIVY